MQVAHCYLEGMIAEEGFLTACTVFTDRGEPGEKGEVFLDFTRLAEPEKALRQLKKMLVPHLGCRLLCSVAENRLTARAATLAQKDGLLVGNKGPVLILPGAAARFLAPLPIRYLWPADPSWLRRLQLLGLKTVGQLAAIPQEELYRSFGPKGLSLAAWSRGRDASRIKNRLPSFITYSVPLAGELSYQQQEYLLSAAAGKLAAEQRSRQAWGERLELMLVPEKGAPQKATREFQVPHVTVPELKFALKQLWPQVWLPTEGLLSINLGPLANLAAQQLNLFWARRPLKDQDRLQAVVQRLQERYPNSVQLGVKEKVSRREQMLAFFDPLRRQCMSAERRQPNAIG